MKSFFYNIILAFKKNIFILVLLSAMDGSNLREILILNLQNL